MRKNYVVFSPTSGRGISKTKALSDYLSLAYILIDTAVKNVIVFPPLSKS